MIWVEKVLFKNVINHIEQKDDIYSDQDNGNVIADSKFRQAT
jgi:hypothetical protein